MKTFLIFSGLLCFCFSQENHIQENFSHVEEECLEELQLNRTEVIKSVSQYLFPEDNEDLKKLFACVWTKENIIDVNGNINDTNFRKYLFNYFRNTQGSSYLIALLATADTVQQCGKAKGKTAGDTAIKMANCVLRKIEVD